MNMFQQGKNKWVRILGALCIVGFVAAAAAMLLNRFGVDIGGYLPYVLLLLCPLSHLLMMPLMHKAMSGEKTQDAQDEQKPSCH
jgi:hypothetical protein